MKRFGKKLISLVLVLCITISMMVMATPSSSAFVGTYIATKVADKALELGIRAITKASTELAALSDDDDAELVVNSLVNLLLLDATGVTVNDISEMCEEILEEIAELSEDVQLYTSEISSSIDKMKLSYAKALFVETWEDDVEHVISPESATEISIGNAFNVYLKYLIASTLNSKNCTQDSDLYIKAADFWVDYFRTDMPADIASDESISKLKKELEKEFVEIQDSNYAQADYDNAKDSVFTNGYVYSAFCNVLDKLITNYTNGSTYTVMDRAATDAYFALPFAHQQYEFLESVAKKQIAMTTLVQMCFNEYLSMQGEYLESKGEVNGVQWDKVGLTYKDHAGEVKTITYAGCSEKLSGYSETNLDKAADLLEAQYKIDSTAYTGCNDNKSVRLKDFMKAEDAQKVYLTIDGYEDSHDYYDEIHDTEADNSMELGNTKKDANKIPEKIACYRIMSGDTSQSVYYILDPSQFADSTEDKALALGYLSEHIKRYGPAGGSDSLYGDLYPVSVDYLNMIKTMSDGQNTFQIPSSNEEGIKKYDSLIKVPNFSAEHGFDLKAFLGGYLPQSSDVYLLTKSYNNHFNTGGNTAVKEAEIDVIYTSNEGTDNTYTIDPESITPSNYGHIGSLYSAVLTNNNDDFKQEFSLTLDDDYDNFEDVEIEVYNYNKDSHEYTLDRTVDNDDVDNNVDNNVAYGGQKLRIKFKVKDIKCFDTLTLKRHNASETSTLLLDNYDLTNSMGVDEKGYYCFDVNMPYSKTEFVLRSSMSNNPEAVIKSRDYGDDAINDVRIVYNEKTYADNEVVNVKNGGSVELGFKLNNTLQFTGVYSYNKVTGEYTTLVDKSALSELTPDNDSWYTITATMSNCDTEFYVVSEEIYMIGDVDLDGYITIVDATLIQKHCAQLVSLNGLSLIHSDVNKDKVISVTDATRIQAHIAKIMPIE